MHERPVAKVSSRASVDACAAPDNVDYFQVQAAHQHVRQGIKAEAVNHGRKGLQLGQVPCNAMQQ
jgi:hypothetical protein